MAGETLINSMSGRLKQEAYKNNPDARNFIAEVATVIMHIILNDGKYDIQINPCLDNFRNRIFDYSVSKIALSRDFNYFQNKNDLELTKIFLEMLDIHFSYEEIREIMLMFSGTKDVTRDYKIVFETYNNKNNDNIDDDDNKTITITKLTNEDEIVRYFNKKVNSGYYKNIYKLLVDFTLMIYRKGSTSIDFSFPSFNKIITFINKNIYTYWVHSKPSEELERTFSYMWKKAKPLHINKAIEAFKIPYPIDKNGDFIIKEAKYSEVTFKEKTEKQNCEIEANLTTVADNSSNANTFIASQIDSVSIKRKMEQLFDYCERDIIDENNLLNNINYLIINKGWTNVYDLFGDISYIILTQKNIAKKTKEKISYHIFKPFEDKQTVFDKSFKKQLVIDTRHDARKSLRAIWFSNYSISTLVKISELFDPIEKTDKLGELKINETCNNYPFYLLEIKEEFSVNDTREPGNKLDLEITVDSISELETAPITPDEVSNSDVLSPIEDIKIIGSHEDIQLFEFYKNAEIFYQTEDKIIKMHKEMASAYKWSHASYYIASISYVILKQLELVNSGWGLNYKKLKNLYRKTVVLLTQFNITFSDENHYKNIDYLRDIFINQYNIKLIVDFYRSIINIPQVNDEGKLLPEEVPTSTSIDSESEVDIQKDDDKISEVTVDTPNDDDYEEDDSQVIEEETDEVEFIEDSEFDNEVEDSLANITLTPQTRAERALADYWLSVFPSGYFDSCIWKNKISTETYEKLFELLKICADENERGFTKRFAKLIVVYCAEWYKREYNGNDGKKNPLKTLGIGCPTSDLWKWAEINNKLLYKTEYLWSIYVLGGFPINYLIRKKFDDFMGEISSAYKSNAEDDSLSERIFINNGTVQESLHQHRGSLFKFKNTIISKQEYPFADTDLEKEPFLTFINGLKDYRREHEKFTLEWVVESNDYTPYFRRKIRLHLNSEDNGIHNKRIPYSRLKTNIKNRKSFNLYLRFNDEDIEETEERQYIRFVNTFNGYFIGEMSDNYFTYSDIPTTPIEKISIVAKNDINDKFEELQEEIVLPYLQLFSTGEYSTYSSKPNKGETFILLPFNYHILSNYNHENESPKFLAEHGTMYRFVQIMDIFSFRDDNGHEVTLYPHNNKIEMVPVVYNDTFVYNDNYYITRITTDEEGQRTETNVFLIFKKSDIKCTRFYDDADPEIFDDKDIIIEFKSEKENRYTEWTDDTQPEKGFLRLHVSVQNKQRLFNVYYIPSESNPFVRDCYKGTIEIKDCVNSIWCSVNNIKGNIVTVNDDYKDPSGCHKRYVEFNIGEERDYAVVKVISPFDIIELYKDGTCIKQYSNKENSILKIPVLYKDAFSFCKFDRQGFTTYELINEDVNLTDLRLEDNDTSLDKTITRETPVGNIEFYLCNSNKRYCINNCIKFSFGEAGAYNYIFYFWDMNISDSPIKLAYSDNNSIDITNYHNGIIFQSLEHDVKPRHYCMPIITTHNHKWPDEYNSEAFCVKCFEIAMALNVPYRVFKPFYFLFTDTDSRLVHFFALIMLLHWNEQNESKIFSELVRFSNEFYFAWPLLNMKVWKQYKGEYDRILNEYGHHIFGDLTKDEFEKGLIERAKKLFVKYGDALNSANSYALNEFTNIYWNKDDDSIPKFASINDEKWYAVDQDVRYDRWKSIYSRAICFMRARRDMVKVRRNDGADGYRTVYPEIIGFTNKEHKDDVRNIEKICDFLQLLYKDDDSFGKIVRFFKRKHIIS